MVYSDQQKGSFGKKLLKGRRILAVQVLIFLRQDLREKIDSNQFTADQLSRVMAGESKIPGFTWHHNAQSAPNNMQLIPTAVHNTVDHLGQGALSKGK
jgi:hypothetical protein